MGAEAFPHWLLCYNALQHELKISMVPMDSSSNWYINRGVPEFDWSVWIVAWDLVKLCWENCGILMLKVRMEPNTKNYYSPVLEAPRSNHVAH